MALAAKRGGTCVQTSKLRNNGMIVSLNRGVDSRGKRIKLQLKRFNLTFMDTFWQMV